MRSLPTYLGVLCVLLSTTAPAAYAEKTQARGQVIRNFARLTFEWPEPTLFTAKASGNTVTLSFDRKADPNMAKILRDLHPYVTKAERRKDGKTITLTLDKPHRIRTFISDNVSGIDILDIKGKGKTVVVKAEQKPAKQQAEKAPASGAKPLLAKRDDTSKLARLEPAAGEEAASQAATAAPTSTPAAAPASAPVAEPVPAAKAESAPTAPTPVPAEAAPKAAAEPAPAEKPPVVEPQTTEPAAPPVVPVQEVPAAEKPVAPAKPATKKAGEEEHTTLSRDTGVSMVPMQLDIAPEEKEPETTEDKTAPPSAVESSQETGEAVETTTNKLVVSSDENAATIRLPLKERTALAVFVRANALWIVIDKKMDLDLSDFEHLPAGVIENGKLFPNDKATVVRVTVADNIYPDIRQQEGKSEVAIILSGKKPEQSSPLEVTINTEPPAPAHVFLPVLEPGNTINIKDPVIGDTLIVTPVYVLEQGLAKTRNFVEFSLLESMQGVVVAKKADDAEVVALRNGLRVSLPQGAHLSPYTDDMKAQGNTVVLSSSDTLFPHEAWKLEANRSMKLAMDRLFNTSVLGANEGEKNLARLRMAQLFLDDGYAPEAIGMLDNIRRTNSSYYRSAKLAAMRGVSNFLMYRFNDASRDFSAAELNGNPEIEFWRGMLADLLGGSAKSSDYLAMNDMYISKYPPVVRQRLAIVAADRAITAKQHNVALKIFDLLEKDDIIAPIQPYVDFLKAKISADNGNEQEAMEVWDRLVNTSTNKFVQARAEFSRILWQMDNNTITRDEAADRLERLRLGWHGDGLELQVVQLLGDLYYEKKDYVNAMRVWQIGVTGFRNTGPAVEMERKMQDTFVTLFNEGIADQMTPLQALALYYEYRNYTPPGAAGVQMIEKLADRLAGVDLLSSAAQLLEQQMRTQLQKEERSRVGTKLAGIYLMNNQPKRAMQALQESVYGENPILMRIQRNQISAEAMMKLGRPAEALATLGQDDSAHAEKIRAMIYWNDKNWPSLISSIENIFKKRSDPSEQMTIEESEFLLRLALAYVFENDVAQLQYLRDYFMPLMRDNPNKMAFDFITAPDIKPNTRNFDDLLATLSKTRSFVDNYKAQVVMADSGEAAAPAPATAAPAAKPAAEAASKAPATPPAAEKPKP